MKNQVEEAIGGKRTVAVVCSQWGDTGKGKIVDLLADWADIIARGTGADNAGHTIWVKGKKHVMHLIPSGILRDSEGKVNVIGSGVAVNPRVVLEEMDMLGEAGLTYDNLMIALNAKLILPQHILLDLLRESEKSGKIGTTGRGVGPVYTDHYARLGLIVNDMLNPAIFRQKLKKNLAEKVALIRLADRELVKKLMQMPRLENGAYYDQESIFNIDAIVERYVEYGRLLKAIISDTDTFMKDNLGTKKILLEGAQGLMLSVDHGSYPYVTSSDCSAQGLAHGVGLNGRDVGLVLNIAKAFYMTRVGGGPFPTEMGGEAAAQWCGQGDVSKMVEKDNYDYATVNSPKEFLQGVAIRMAGDEYGATTGRPRRVGWLDLPVLRYATRQNGHKVVFTKLDVLSEVETIKICDSYIYRGEPYQYGNGTINDGDVLDVAIPYAEVMANCEPVYKEFPGWLTDISGMRAAKELPQQLLDILRFVEVETGAVPKILSVGADREATIIL